MLKQEYWLNIANQLKNRGDDEKKIKRIITTCSDNKTANQIIEYIRR